VRVAPTPRGDHAPARLIRCLAGDQPAQGTGRLDRAADAADPARLGEEVVTPWAIAGWPLVVVGGFFNPGELFVGLRQSLTSGYFYATGAHVSLDPKAGSGS
jgi:hypothetical protein